METRSKHAFAGKRAIVTGAGRGIGEAIGLFEVNRDAAFAR